MPYILDIDLDFFSVLNPFIELHDEINLYEKLATLYAFQIPESTDTMVSRATMSLMTQLHEGCRESFRKT